ncbi:drug resistance protein [Actinobacillus pleuropneumoniae]|nr:drug resistance protein [Actinobacillus pleuropneumoniae]
MNPWVLLGFAIVIEVIGSNCIKASEGFSKPLPTAVAIGAFVIALYLLSVITKHYRLVLFMRCGRVSVSC